MNKPRKKSAGNIRNRRTSGIFVGPMVKGGEDEAREECEQASRWLKGGGDTSKILHGAISKKADIFMNFFFCLRFEVLALVKMPVLSFWVSDALWICK
jgi:hypothetical protein